MSRVILSGMNGANPQEFLASIGLLRIASKKFETARLSFLEDGSYRPVIDGVNEPLAELVAENAASGAGEQPWRLTYGKAEKRGEKAVADLKAPPDAFRGFLTRNIDAWLAGNGESAAFAAAYGTSTAVDGKGNTKPTAFHFTAANQQFLGAIEFSRAAVDVEWSRQALFKGNAARPGGNVRWDPAADRNYALMAENPNTDGTAVCAPLEWLAFNALPLLPTVPIKARVFTTGISGRGDEMAFTWPLWNCAASTRTVASLVRLRIDEWRERGVFAFARSTIRRSSQGFGNFGPASVST